jgi:creatinine amidohydrolase/Fe(II)-dependent formamide hydrolase-like protein
MGSLSDKTSGENSRVDSVIIALGSTEQHGPHLPLSTDTIIAEEIAGKISEKTKIPLGTSMPYGVSPEHMGFPGTLSLKPETLREVMLDLIESYRHHGVKKIIIINGHGGNNKHLTGLAPDTVLINLTCLPVKYDHAGEAETSLMLHIRPDLVLTDKITAQEYTMPGSYDWDDTRKYTSSGVLGHPELASPEKGGKLFDELVAHTLNRIQE